MEIHQSTVILLLILCVSLSTYGQPADVRQRYEKFLKQHVYGGMTVNKCDSEIRKRKISKGLNDNDCKDVNSFIQANKDQVRAVCTGGGTPEGKFFVSNQPFPVITCNLKRGARHPKCEYRGIMSTRKIVVACDQEWPTHYEEGRIVPA